MTETKVTEIEHPDTVSPRKQLGHKNRAEIAGAAGHQNAHLTPHRDASGAPSSWPHPALLSQPQRLDHILHFPLGDRRVERHGDYAPSNGLGPWERPVR